VVPPCFGYLIKNPRHGGEQSRLRQLSFEALRLPTRFAGFDGSASVFHFWNQLLDRDSSFIAFSQIVGTIIQQFTKHVKSKKCDRKNHLASNKGESISWLCCWY